MDIKLTLQLNDKQSVVTVEGAKEGVPIKEAAQSLANLTIAALNAIFKESPEMAARLFTFDNPQNKETKNG